MRADLPTGTVTFLFTDVEGSTKLLQSLGAEAYADALAEHRGVVRQACASRGGVEVDTQGDAFFFAFPSAVGAITAASEVIDVLDSGPIHVRVGMHTGTALLTGDGYVGDDVHLAARVAASGHGGQVILSAATADLVEVSLTDLGEHRLEDIEVPISIYQLGDASFPPLKTISNTNLPRPASSFVGREGELAEVLGCLEEGARLVTLTGPGGTGKTRLAIEAAALLVPSYKAGVFWVGLAAVLDPALVIETIGQTLGTKGTLAEHVGERELLLLLDNLEQVVECVPDLATLLTACPNLTLLVTSRELLRIAGEVEYPVPPLVSGEAVSLFCARSRLEPSDEIAELCARLDSLPLAVELAAARTKALSPVQILARVAQRLDLLEGGRDADPRQQTLRATIEWSYDLLTPQEQVLFARLSVFRGGCTLETAEEVCGTDLGTLQSLVEKSLVRFTNERFWMLATIGAYATERLRASSDEAHMQAAHADHFIRVARDAEALRSEGGAGWLDALEREQDNYRATFERLGEAGRSRELFDLIGFVLQLWWMRGERHEGLRICRRALERGGADRTEGRGRTLKLAGLFAISVGERDAAIAYAEGSLAIFEEIGHHEQMTAVLINLGGFLTESAPEDARRHLEAAVELSGRIGLPSRQLVATSNLANLELQGGEYELARTHLEEVVGLQREFGEGHEIVMPLFNLALSLLLAGDEGAAVPRAREGLETAAPHGDVRGLVNLLMLFANVAVRRGDARFAAQLVGAADAARLRAGIDRIGQHAEAVLIEDTSERLRLALGSDCDGVVETGRAMSVDEAVELALASIN